MKTTHSPQRILFTLFFTIFLDVIGLGIAIPTLAILFLDPHSAIVSADMSQASRQILYGFLIASYPLAQFFGAPLLGSLSDRYGRRKLLLLSLFGTFLAYLVFAWAIITHNLILLFLSRIVDGFTGGNISIAQSAIADISDEKSKSRNFGLIGMAFGLGFVIGPTLGGVLADPTIFHWFSLSFPFWLAAGLTATNMLLVTLFLTETLKQPRFHTLTLLTGLRNVHKAFTIGSLRWLFAVIFFYILGFSSFTQFFQVFLIRKFHYDQSDIGFLFGFFGICIALSQGVIIRPLSRRFLPGSILKVSMLLNGLLLPLLLIPTQAIWLYAIMPFISAFQGLTMPNSAAVVSNSAPREEQGEVLGLNQSVQSLATAIPPLVAGFASAMNINLPIALASLAILIAWALFMLTYKPKHG